MNKNFMRPLSSEHAPSIGMDRLVFKTTDGMIHYGGYHLTNDDKNVTYRRWIESKTGFIYDSHTDVIEWINGEEVAKAFIEDIKSILIENDIDFFMFEENVQNYYLYYKGEIVDRPALTGCIIKIYNSVDYIDTLLIDNINYEYYDLFSVSIHNDVICVLLIEKGNYETKQERD